MAPARLSTARQPVRLPYLITRRLASPGLWLVGALLSSMAVASGLTPQQVAQARALSLDTLWPQARNLVAEHPLGLQTLSIEKQVRKKHPDTRWVSVYQYNYTAQSARLLTIDLDSDQVTKQTSINSVHLPLNGTEITFAQSLLNQDTDMIKRLQQEQVQRSQSAFALLSELDLKASIYEPIDPADDCQQQRCALISLFDKTRTVFAIEPVINLTTQQVRALQSR